MDKRQIYLEIGIQNAKTCAHGQVMNWTHLVDPYFIVILDIRLLVKNIPKEAKLGAWNGITWKGRGVKQQVIIARNTHPTV